MEYRGVKYSVIQGNSGVWKWAVTVGKPPMLRIGEASTEQQVKIEVHRIIDRAIELEAKLRQS